MDIIPVSSPPTPGRENPFQDKPTRHEVVNEKIAKELLYALVYRNGEYPEGFHLDDMLGNLGSDLEEGSHTKFTKAHFEVLIELGVLDYNEATETYTINFASPEVRAVLES